MECKGKKDERQMNDMFEFEYRLLQEFYNQSLYLEDFGDSFKFNFSNNLLYKVGQINILDTRNPPVIKFSRIYIIIVNEILPHNGIR